MMEYDTQQMRREDTNKHSEFGIGSFCISIMVNFITWMTIIGIAFVPDSSRSDSSDIIVGLAAIFVVFLDVIGLGLGITGLVIKGRKKMFPIIGLVLNAFPILIVGFLIILGSM